MRSILSSLIVLAIIFSACKSTKKAYQRGDYETAVFNSVKRLQSSPKNKKSRETLAKAYPDMVDFYEDQIQNLKLGNDTYRWEKVIDYYEILNRAYSEISRIPAARTIIPNPKNYQSELNDAQYKAAEVRYALGMQDLELGRQGNRFKAKEAFYSFRKVDELQRGFRDTQDRMYEAKDLATVMVVIEPIPMHSRTLALSNEFFDNQMTEFIKATKMSPFVQFITPQETRMLNRDPDHVIQMVFDDFVVGQAYVKETVFNRTQDSVVVGEVEISPDSVADVYGSVKAEVHQFQKEISSSGLLDFRIIDGRSGSIVSQRKFPGTFVWFDKWGFYNGDDRALTDEDEEFMRRKRESPNPPPQDLFIEFTKPIFDQVTNYVRNYYRDY